MLVKKFLDEGCQVGVAKMYMVDKSKPKCGSLRGANRVGEAVILYLWVLVDWLNSSVNLRLEMPQG